jgi:ABC-2 type transport system ATP-binding protein
MPAEFAVSARALRKNFGTFTAVDGVSFDVRPGEIFGFLGANGAGKTTAIRMLCGLLPPTSGSATVAGFDIGTQVHEVKGAIGYMSQRFSLYEDISVGENIEFYGGVYGLSRAAIAAKSAALLADLGLSDQRDLLTRSLPLGWKQRLALGTALLHEPSIIFLDEPTGGVDPISRRRFWRIIYELAEKGTTVFVTTHYMDEAEYCNRISIMHQGAIVALGSPTALKQEYRLGTVQDVFVHLITGSTDR